MYAELRVPGCSIRWYATLEPASWQPSLVPPRLKLWPVRNDDFWPGGRECRASVPRWRVPSERYALRASTTSAASMGRVRTAGMPPLVVNGVEQA
ncbi:hypothetical protein ACVWXU_008435 [Streptomyces sp. TE33382]